MTSNKYEQWKQISNAIKIETTSPLGKGGQGTVYRGTYVLNNIETKVAVKEIKRVKSNSKYLFSEIEILEKLIKVDCPNIVKIYTIFPSLSELKANSNYEHVYIVMEQCDCDLHDYYSKSSKNIDQVLNILIQIAKGMASIHQNNIIHRDLKAQNIFVKKDKSENNYVFKIGDLGIGINGDIAETAIGTLNYMAPEMIGFNSSAYTKNIDIWAFGVLAHWIITGKYIFDGRTQQQLIFRITNFKSYLQEWQDAKNSQVVTTDPTKIGLKAITSTSIAQFIDSVLKVVPNQRISFQDIVAKLNNFIVGSSLRFPSMFKRVNNFAIPSSYGSLQKQELPQQPQQSIQNNQQPFQFGQQNQNQLNQLQQRQQQQQNQIPTFQNNQYPQQQKENQYCQQLQQEQVLILNQDNLRSKSQNPEKFVDNKKLEADNKQKQFDQQQLDFIHKLNKIQCEAEYQQSKLSSQIEVLQKKNENLEQQKQEILNSMRKQNETGNKQKQQEIENQFQSENIISDLQNEIKRIKIESQQKLIQQERDLKKQFEDQQSEFQMKKMELSNQSQNKLKYSQRELVQQIEDKTKKDFEEYKRNLQSDLNYSYDQQSQEFREKEKQLLESRKELHSRIILLEQENEELKKNQLLVDSQNFLVSNLPQSQNQSQPQQYRRNNQKSTPKSEEETFLRHFFNQVSSMCKRRKKN